MWVCSSAETRTLPSVVTVAPSPGSGPPSMKALVVGERTETPAFSAIAALPSTAPPMASGPPPSK
jgi:hypothetical protein